MIFSYECWECNEHPLFMSRDDLILHKIKTHHVEYPTIKSYENREPREGCREGIDAKDFLDDDAAYLFALRRDRAEVKNKVDRLKLEVDSITGAKEAALKEITNLEKDLAEVTKIEKDFLKECRYKYLRDDAQIYLKEKQDNQNDNIINEQQLAEEMMTVLRQFNIIMAQKIVKQKNMSESLIQAKFDIMQNKFDSMENKVEQQNKELEQLKNLKTLDNSQNEKILISKDKNCLDYEEKVTSLEAHIKVLEKEKCTEKSLWTEKEMVYVKKIEQLENAVKNFKNIHLKNNDKLKGCGKNDKEINSRKKDVEIQKQKVRDLTKKIKKLEDQQKTKDEMSQKLQRELAKLQKQNNSLKATNNNQESTIKDLENLNIDLNTSNELLSKELIEEKTFVGELRDMSDVQHQKMRHLLKENDSLYFKCRERRERVKDQEFKIRELKEDRDFLREDLKIMKEETTKLESELDKVREENANLRERPASLGRYGLPCFQR